MSSIWYSKANVDTLLATIRTNVASAQASASSAASSAAQALAAVQAAYLLPTGGIPLGDLTTSLQALVSKAGTALQNTAGAVAKSNLATSVQTSLGKADSALQSVPTITASMVGSDIATQAELDAAVAPLVSGSGITRIVGLSQADYDALSPKQATTLYVITG